MKLILCITAAALLLLHPMAWSCTDAYWRVRHKLPDGPIGSVAIDDGIMVVGDYAQYSQVFVFASDDGYWSVQEILMASDGPGGEFGYSVAVRDGVVAVGARFKDDFAGAAYVFRQIGRVWTEESKLIPSDSYPGISLAFGFAVALQGTSLLVGSPYDINDGLNTGSVFAYEFIAGTWTEQAKLTASDGGSGSTFGFSLAADNGRLFVGAAFDDALDASWSGSVYLFQRVSDLWTEQAKLTASDGESGDRFGWSVGLEGDTLAIGGPLAVSATVYLYEFIEGFWSEQSKLTGAADHDSFGMSLALYDGTLAVGAPLDGDIGFHAGAAYVYCRMEDGSWEKQVKLLARDVAEDHEFGSTIAVHDGVMVVGGPNGFAYLFEQVPILSTAPPSTEVPQVCNPWLSRCETPDECCSGACRWRRCRLFGFPSWFRNQ